MKRNRPDDDRLADVFNTIEPYVENHYGIPVIIKDVPNPFTGDLDGSEIHVDHAEILESAVFVVAHLFGHTVQWNLSAEAREIGYVVQANPSAEMFDRLHEYESKRAATASASSTTPGSPISISGSAISPRATSSSSHTSTAPRCLRRERTPGSLVHRERSGGGPCVGSVVPFSVISVVSVVSFLDRDSRGVSGLAESRAFRHSPNSTRNVEVRRTRHPSNHPG